uniref:Ig-like domain-containing protein n=1 Tax=Amphimedon queenslandica TaxID=400682 RepID=A0A1X7SGD9_AMPQE
SVSINGSAPESISNFAPSVPSGYTISPSNPRIRLTSSGELETDELGPEDSGTYTFSSPDLGGATLSIGVNVLGIAHVISISGPQTVPSGSSVDISVVPGGTPDFTYQWFRNGMAIPGETGSTLSIRNIRTTDIGLYSCTVSNSRGSANSSSTAISVTSSVSINGSAPESISNFAPSVPSGYTISPSNPRIRLTSSGELETDELGPEDSGTYTFSSPDLGGATLSIGVNVLGIAHVISISGPQTVPSGSSVDISVVPGGTPDFTYQWFRNGMAIPGETGSTLSIRNIRTTDIGLYSCT